MPRASFAGDNAEEPAEDSNAKRTVLLYMCGSDLETDGGMAQVFKAHTHVTVFSPCV